MNNRAHPGGPNIIDITAELERRRPQPAAPMTLQEVWTYLISIAAGPIVPVYSINTEQLPTGNGRPSRHILEVLRTEIALRDPAGIATASRGVRVTGNDGLEWVGDDGKKAIEPGVRDPADR